MTKAINKVFISGNTGAKISYNDTGNGVPACSFSIASDRRSPDGVVITVWAKINVYGSGMVNVCRNFFEKGAYVFVEGELMSRNNMPGSEVRAKELIFCEFSGGHNGER